MVSFPPRHLYLRGKSPRYPLDRRMGGPQRRSGRYGEVTVLDPYQDSNSDSLASSSTALLRFTSFIGVFADISRGYVGANDKDDDKHRCLPVFFYCAIILFIIITLIHFQLQLAIQRPFQKQSSSLRHSYGT
jgi:hypothetical protein